MPTVDTLLLTNCTVVDCALPGRSQGGAALLVRDGRIAAVAPSATLEAEARAAGERGERWRLIDLDEGFVLPGLCDAHVHLGDVVPPHVAAYAGEGPGAHMVRCVRKAQDNLRFGITSLRSLGERHDADVVLRNQITAGVIEGPRIFASGDVAWTARAAGPDEYRRETRRMARLGVDQVKVLGSGGIPTRSAGGITTPFLGRDELAAVCEEAASWELPVVLHAMGDETVRLGLELGVRSIEHGFAMSEAVVPALAASATALCPNLVVTESWDPAWMAPAGLPSFMVRNAAEARARHHDVVRACLAAGVRVLAGADDLPEPAGPVGIERVAGRPGLFRELELLVELGASTGEALQAATIHPAWAVGRDDELGSVEVGKIADLVVLAEDPLSDVAAVASLRLVLQAGRPISMELSPDDWTRGI